MAEKKNSPVVDTSGTVNYDNLKGPTRLRRIQLDDKTIKYVNIHTELSKEAQQEEAQYLHDAGRWADPPPHIQRQQAILGGIKDGVQSARDYVGAARDAATQGLGSLIGAGLHGAHQIAGRMSGVPAPPTSLESSQETGQELAKFAVPQTPEEAAMFLAAGPVMGPALRRSIQMNYVGALKQAGKAYPGMVGAGVVGGVVGGSDPEDAIIRSSLAAVPPTVLPMVLQRVALMGSTRGQRIVGAADAHNFGVMLETDPNLRTYNPQTGKLDGAPLFSNYRDANELRTLVGNGKITGGGGQDLLSNQQGIILQEVDRMTNVGGVAVYTDPLGRVDPVTGHPKLVNFSDAKEGLKTLFSSARGKAKGVKNGITEPLEAQRAMENYHERSVKLEQELGVFDPQNAAADLLAQANNQYRVGRFYLDQGAKAVVPLQGKEATGDWGFKMQNLQAEIKAPGVQRQLEARVTDPASWDRYVEAVWRGGRAGGVDVVKDVSNLPDVASAITAGARGNPASAAYHGVKAISEPHWLTGQTFVGQNQGRVPAVGLSPGTYDMLRLGSLYGGGRAASVLRPGSTPETAE